MTRRHRMTPKRKTALRKAQMISARKRRRNIALIAGGAGVLAGVGAGAYFGHKQLSRRQHPTAPPTKGRELDVIRVRPVVGAKVNNWPIVGSPVRRTQIETQHGKHKSQRKRPNYRESEALRLKKEKQRQTKNFRARRKYWRAKPIGRRKKGRKS